MKHGISVFLALLFLTGTACASEELTLSAYMDAVVNGNHTIKAEESAVVAAYYELLASVSYQRPSVSLSASGNYLTGNSQSGVKENDITSSRVGLGIRQIIDVAGKYKLDEQQQILLYEERQANLSSIKNNILAQAEEKFRNAVFAKKNIELQEDVLRQREENKKITDSKYKQQVVSNLDVVRADSLVSEACSFVTEAKAQYGNILAQMAALAGGKDSAPDIKETGHDVPVLDFDVTLEKAFATRSDVKAKTLSLERSKVIKKLEAKGMAPTLEAALEWIPYSDPGELSSPQKEEAQASLRLNIPLLDGNGTKNRTLRAHNMAKASLASLKSMEDSVRMELKTAYNDWEKACALEADKKSQVNRSNEELRITSLMYKEGLGAQIDLINAQTENRRVRTEYLNSVKEMHNALVALRKVMGGYAGSSDAEFGK